MKDEHKTSKIDRFNIRYASWVVKRKWLVLALSIVIMVLCGYGFSTLGFNADSKVFFSKENPQLQAFEALENVYSKDDNILIAVEARDGNIFTKEHLTALKTLVDSAWLTPYSFRVDAITNYQYTRADGDDLYVSDLVGNVNDLNPSTIENIKKVTLAEPLLYNRLINDKGSITGINISTKLPADSEALNEAVTYIRGVVSSWSEAHPNLNTYMSGNMMLSNAFSESAQSDGQTLIPLVFLIFLIMIYVTTRSISGTISAILVVFFSISCALGIAGILGIDLTSVSANTPIVISTLAIADCIHILITTIQQMRKGKAKNQAIIESLRLNTVPVFITSITTIIGFLSLNTGDVPPFADFGNISAMGMFFALVFALTMLPALLAILPMKVKAVSETDLKKSSFYTKFGDFVVAQRTPILISSIVLIALGSVFMIKNELNDEYLEYFDESISFRTDSEFINNNLTGIYSLEFSIGAGEAEKINDPVYLQKLEDFATFAKAQPEVIHVSSFSEVSKKINKAMHGDDVSFYGIPKSQQEAAQYLLLYELSLPYGLDLNNQVNVDKSETRFTLTLKDLSSSEMIGFTKKMENWLKDNTPDYMHATGTSQPLIFAYLSARQLKSLVSGSLISAVLITLILILSFRSLKYGLVSMIPNIAPAIIGFGIWYFYLGYVNLGMTAVFGMTLGIIVDDTVHFISKYLRAKREMGLETRQAIEYSFSTVGKAIVSTTLVLCVGFIVLAQSSFLLNAALASITTIVIMAALVIVLVTLPAVLLVNQKKRVTQHILTSKTT
ncbi:efflux RND transporter permease subunit [Winogradskyella sp.]|uniref:efflux RND transporter permease subunit n=1 Tax=Winogradskyella sp. TaxID=1883156 RepID=UPI00261B7443|nr:efflux RND transporter permease subunit [Winogradskyella sp.]